MDTTLLLFRNNILELLIERRVMVRDAEGKTWPVGKIHVSDKTPRRGATELPGREACLCLVSYFKLYISNAKRLYNIAAKAWSTYSE
jgi:hypothetical protein